jgi:hypothetical protein
MPTPRETILAALHARLSALPATALHRMCAPVENGLYLGYEAVFDLRRP